MLWRMTDKKPAIKEKSTLFLVVDERKIRQIGKDILDETSSK